MISLFSRTRFPVPADREFACSPLELQRESTSGFAKMARNAKNSLLISL